MSSDNVAGLTDFLRARIAEDEATVARHGQEEAAEYYVDDAERDFDGMWLDVVDGNTEKPTIGIGPGRMRAECAAKRRILHAYEQRAETWPDSDLALALLAIALPYRAHAAFDPDWLG